jgi:crotonobetainyl-CoA:carnitine CoA-transferase CaiB-like acyl-CoA transferase
MTSNAGSDSRAGAVTTDAPRPLLDGIRVVEWTAYINGTGAGYILSELGADVLKIEDPIKGDPYRSVDRIWGLPAALPGGRHVGVELVNRNKRSLGVDLKHAGGRDLVHDLVREADVFYTNYFRNDVLARVGLNYETLKQINPRLVYVLTTGWGGASREANSRAFGQAVEARLGAMWLAGDKAFDQPFMVHNSGSDMMGATIVALSAMAALFDRSRTGEGCLIETSLVGSQLHLMGHAMNIALLKGATYERHSRSTTIAPFNNYYRCKDGNWIFLAEPEARRFVDQFRRVLELEGESDLATLLDPERSNELIAVLDGRFMTRTRQEWVERFTEFDVDFAWAPINTVAEATSDPVLIDNDYLPWLDHPTLGRVRTVGLPIRLNGRPLQPRRAAPALGEGGDEVLAEWLGYTGQQIDELRGASAIR